MAKISLGGKTAENTESTNTGTAKVGATPVTPAAPKSADAPKSNVEAATEAAAPINTPVSPNLGKMSDTLEFVCALGDPSRDDVTTRVVGGKQVKDNSAKIVGYRFKSKVDITIPDCGTQSDLKSNPMSYDNINGQKQVKAGEVFDLTRFETALLLSGEDYNARATGGSLQVVACYVTKGGGKNGKGTVAKAAQESWPTCSLKGINGSVKDMKMVNVLTFTAEKRSNGTTRKTRTIVPGFEKWLPLCEEATKKSGVSRSQDVNSRNKGAESFMNMVKMKRSKGM